MEEDRSENPSSNGEQIDWSGALEPVARLIFEQGGKYLLAQTQMALAADQRALTVSTLLVGFATALYAASVGYWTTSVAGDIALPLSGLIAGTVMLAGAAMCGYSARPGNFYSAGNEPENWWDWTALSVSELLGIESENYNEHIADNADLLDANAIWLEKGLALSSLAPVAGLISWIVIRSFF